MPDGLDAFNQSPGVGVQCGDCGAHYLLSPSGDVDNAACEDCGGKRFFRTQPSPVHDDLSGENTLKDMPPAGGGPDTGGNPLGEGSIVAALVAHLGNGLPPIGYDQPPRRPLDFTPDPESIQNTQPYALGMLDQYGLPIGENGEQMQAPIYPPDTGFDVNPLEERNPTANDPRWSNLEAPGLDDGQVDVNGIPLNREPPLGIFDPNANAGNPDLARGVAGFPLSEGTIVGDNGEPSPLADTHGYDGYTHSSVYPNNHPFPEEMYPDDQISGYFTGPNGQQVPVPKPGSDGGRSPSQIDMLDVTHLPPMPDMPWVNPDVPGNLGPVHQGGQNQSHNVMSMEFPSRDTLNMDPYPALFSDEHVAGIFNTVENGLAALTPVDQEIPGLDVLSDAADVAKGASSLMKGVGFAKSMFGGGGGGQAAGGMFPEQAPAMQQLGSTDIPMLVVADLETPGSVKSVDEQHDDPQEQDQKEFDDGDKSPSNLENPNNEDSGASGEDGVRDNVPGYGFGPNSPAIQHMMSVLPLLVHYITNGLDGSDDPILQDLHEKLDSESPGYLNNDHPDGQNIMQMIIQKHNPKQSRLATVPLPPVPTPASSLTPQPSPGADAFPSVAKPQICPNCHGVTNGDGTCPQCTFPAAGTGLPQNQVTANNFGEIQNNEQAAAVMNYLKEHPEDSSKSVEEIMALIQGNQNPVPKFVQPQPQPAPMPPMEQAPGAMPVMDPSQPGGGGGQPMQPMAGTHEGAGINTLYDIADQRQSLPQEMQHQIDDLLVHYGPEYTLRFIQQMGGQLPGQKAATADNMAPRCPECGSATTSVVDGIDSDTDDQRAECHSCHKIFPLQEKKSQLIALANPAIDPQRIWQDSNGNPIQEGDQYSLYTAGVPVPDEVTVLSKKPGELQLQLAGTSADFRINASDVQSGKYSFEPATNSAAYNNEIPHGNHPLDNANVIQEPTTDQITDQYPNAGTTSSVDEHDYDDDGSCRKCGSDDTFSIMSSPTTEMHECFRCAHVWETVDDSEYGPRAANTELAWVMNGDSEDFFADMDRHRAAREDHSGASRNIHDVAARDPRLAEIRERLDANPSIREAITAGRNFTQAEKRELIDEHGHARNLGQLDLANTHYRVDDEYIARRRGNGLDAPDEHLIFGL